MKADYRTHLGRTTTSPNIQVRS